ncbi:MAG TPA: hypothetical protein VHR18_13405 [Solirubrobacterales bacterium]|jgi:hypothetical protein|nr:hypothetical protein [Solirubrobacterales bacterium]
MATRQSSRPWRPSLQRTSGTPGLCFSIGSPLGERYLALLIHPLRWCRPWTTHTASTDSQISTLNVGPLGVIWQRPIRDSTTPQAVVLAALAAVALLLVVSVGAVEGSTASATERTVGGACFPAGSWDADLDDRPCVRIVRVAEDGSFSYAVTDADGTRRYRGAIGATDR